MADYNNVLATNIRESKVIRESADQQKLASFKRFSGIQRNFEIGFRCLVLLEKISFDKIFEAVTQKLAIRCK